MSVLYTCPTQWRAHQAFGHGQPFWAIRTRTRVCLLFCSHKLTQVRQSSPYFIRVTISCIRYRNQGLNFHSTALPILVVPSITPTQSSVTSVCAYFLATPDFNIPVSTTFIFSFVRSSSYIRNLGECFIFFNNSWNLGISNFEFLKTQWVMLEL